MSMRRQCDKCGAVIDGDTAAEVPAVVVLVDGETILEFEDACDTCKERVVTNTSRYLAVSTRKRKTAAE